MVKQLVVGELWTIIEALLWPLNLPSPKAAGRQVPTRAALAGIIYVLRSGISWRMLPKEFGCSGVTCWRRLRDWQRAGVWYALRLALLDKLGRLGLIDWSRAYLDSASIPAKKGARKPVLTL